MGPIISILKCHRVMNLKHPHPASIKRHCTECGGEVWVMPKNLILNFPLMCYECSDKLHEEMLAKGEKVEEYLASEAFKSLGF